MKQKEMKLLPSKPYYHSFFLQGDEYFGDLVDGQMIPHEIGEIADMFLKEIPQHFD